MGNTCCDPSVVEQGGIKEKNDQAIRNAKYLGPLLHLRGRTFKQNKRHEWMKEEPCVTHPHMFYSCDVKGSPPYQKA